MYGVLSIDVSITVAVNLMPVLALAKNRELEYPWGVVSIPRQDSSYWPGSVTVVLIYRCCYDSCISLSHCQTLCDNLRVRIHTRSIISVIRDITGRAPREKTSGDCIAVHLTASGCTWRVPTACAGGGHVPCRCSRCPGTGTCERCAGPCLISVMS